MVPVTVHPLLVGTSVSFSPVHLPEEAAGPTEFPPSLSRGLGSGDMWVVTGRARRAYGVVVQVNPLRPVGATQTDSPLERQTYVIQTTDGHELELAAIYLTRVSLLEALAKAVG